MTHRLMLASLALAAFTAPAFAQGNPNTTANRAGNNAFGTTAFGDRNTNAFGRSDTARQNADRMAGSFPTQTSHGTWPETGPNPPDGAPLQ